MFTFHIVSKIERKLWKLNDSYTPRYSYYHFEIGNITLSLIQFLPRFNNISFVF